MNERLQNLSSQDRNEAGPTAQPGRACRCGDPRSTININDKFDLFCGNDHGSTTDQLQALRIVSEACGKASIRTFTDEAASGSALANRPDLQALLTAAARGEIDKVRAEVLDRLSRDQEDIAHIYKRLQYAGVALETISEGHVTDLHVGLKGTMNQMFLTELGNKTRRGLVARVKDGFSGGGRCYGYDLGDKGELTINTRQAGVICSIFER